eukprot:gene63998-87520_t
MDRYAATLMGVDTIKVFAVTFALGAALAGAAGALLSPIFPISPLAGTTYLGKAFVICVLGGLGSVSGALVGGLETLPRPGAFSHAVLHRADPAAALSAEWHHGQARFRMKQSPMALVGLSLLVLVIAVLPFSATNYVLRLTTIAFMYIALASSWNI